jgi:putative transposase
MFFAEQSVKPKYLIRDHDSKFVQEFDDILQADGMEVVKVGPRAANMNAYAERWVQSV